MANIAQTVNVLQAMILTKGDEMVLTPSYYVFRMYKDHQDATMLPVDLESPKYSHGDNSIPALTASASRDADGILHLSLTNANPNESVSVSCETGRHRNRQTTNLENLRRSADRRTYDRLQRLRQRRGSEADRFHRGQGRERQARDRTARQIGRDAADRERFELNALSGETDHVAFHLPDPSQPADHLALPAAGLLPRPARLRTPS